MNNYISLFRGKLITYVKINKFLQKIVIVDWLVETRRAHLCLCIIHDPGNFRE